MHNAVAFLQELISDDGFAISILAVVAVAAILAFGFGATQEIIAPLLILGVNTALVERKLRGKRKLRANR